MINGYENQAMIAAVGSGTSDQWGRANVVSEADAQPGDLVFQRGPEAGSANHVGIICGKLTQETGSSYIVLPARMVLQ